MNIWGDEEGMCHAKKICAHHGKSLYRDNYVGESLCKIL